MKSFLRKNNCNYKHTHKTTTSLQARSITHTQTIISKRISLNTSRKGSLTVEASLIVPLFLFAIIHILSAIDMIAIHSRIEAAIHQTGKEMAQYGYAYAKVDKGFSDLGKTVANVGFTELYAKKQVIEYLGNAYLDSSVIKGGAKGILFLQSSLMVEDIIDLAVTYEVSPRFSIIGFQKFTMVNRCRMRAWTGYDNTQEYMGQTSEEMVYITDTGTVFHMNRKCSHLDLSISLVLFKDVKKLRNSEGEKYYLCEVCGDGGISETVYVTQDGNRYHNLLNCSGLKRTILTIPISEVGSKLPCSRCGSVN